jgi:carbamoyl-phosphate synthase small subunit
VLLSLQGTFPPAILALADGTVFIGNSIGATGSTVGEVVFNTAMTGYQEILTDPSYCQQIVTLTYPHIGNYGVNPQDIEADKVHAAGLIIKDLPLLASNFRATRTLSQYLVAEHTVAIANIDTRKLTRLLRTRGAQNGAVVGLAAGEVVTQALVDQAIAAAQGAPSMAGQDLAKVGVRGPALRVDPDRMETGATRWPTRLWHPGRTDLPCRRLRLWREKEHPAHAG